MMRREGGRVVIDISEGQYAHLMIAVGYAIGAGKQRGEPWSAPMIRLANAINEGNPDWTPYEVPDPKAK